MNLYKIFTGTNSGTDAKVEAKREEAHKIKNAMTKDIMRIKSKVDKINKNTNNSLREISADLESVTYKIAVAAGGKKRGL